MPAGTAEVRKRYDLSTVDYDYPMWRGKPKRTILMCSHMRSGSTLLGEAMTFAGGLGCPLEYYHRGFRPDLANRWGSRDIETHIDAVQRLRTDPSGTMSVKLFWRDVQEMVAELDPANFGDIDAMRPETTMPETYRAIAALIAPAFPNPVYIHLWRRDRLRQAVSSLTAIQTGKWRSIPQMGERPDLAPAEYDFDRIDQLLSHAEACEAHWHNFFSAIGVQPHELTYEQMSADYERSVAGVFAFLDSDAQVPEIRMRKQSGSGNEAFVLRYLRERGSRGP